MASAVWTKQRLVDLVATRSPDNATRQGQLTSVVLQLPDTDLELLNHLSEDAMMALLSSRLGGGAGTSQAGSGVPSVVAPPVAAPSLPKRTDAQILEEIREEFDGYKRFLKPVKVYALGLEQLLHAYLFSSRIRVVVALYSFIVGFVIFCALKAWVPLTAWVLTFCIGLASMHRDHQKDDMKVWKDHLDKLKKVQVKLQEIHHLHPDAQALKAELDIVVSELESWYQAAEQWFRMH